MNLLVMFVDPMVVWNRESGKPSSTTNLGIVVGYRLQRIKEERKVFCVGKSEGCQKKKKSGSRQRGLNAEAWL
jgi:hypothetical protein